MKAVRELDHLSTTDEKGKRVKIFAAEIKNGFWSKRRTYFQWVLIFFYLLLPWIRIGGHPLLLLDLVHRRFSIFGKLFFAHEVPNLVFITLSFLLFIGLVTTLFGRAWCGWSCPQTVFVDRIFRKIEYRIEGDFIAQRKLHLQPLHFDKLLKKSLKWFCFILITVLLSHSFLAYFVGSAESFQLLTQSPSQNWNAFLFVLIFSGIVLFDFGWFKEQFCLIACPYGKMQSVMMDEGSLYLVYDQKREDCVHCNKCVSVCPTGIDVRNGLQIECIACTACADACDSIMKKIKKPLHLIGYGNSFSLQNKKTPLLRGRVLVYGSLLTLALSILFFRIDHRLPHQTEITRAVDIPYQMIQNADGSKSIINHFKIRFYNLDWDESKVQFSLSSEALEQKVELIRNDQSKKTLSIESGSFNDQQFFIKVPLDFFSHHQNRKISILSSWDQNETKRNELNLVGPENAI